MENVESYRDDERRYVLVLDARFGMTFNRLQQRFYAHMLTAISLLQIVAGSAAVTALVTRSVALSAAAGVVIAIVGAVGAIIDLGGRAARFDEHSRRYAELDARSLRLSTEELSERLSELQASGPAGEIDALSQPAYNANLRANGRDDAVVPVTALGRVLAAFA